MKGNRKERVWRSYSVSLTDDMTDLRFCMEDSALVEISVSLPSGAPSVKGLLSATSGIAREEVKVRLETQSGPVRHQTWADEGFFSNCDTAETLHISLQRGDWQARLELPGYETWKRNINVADAKVHAAVLQPLPGRRLKADYTHDYYRVEVRPTQSGGDWQLLLWRDARIRASHTPTPEVTSAFLAPGTYDFRISSVDGVQRIFERIKIETSSEIFTVDFQLSTGNAVRGTLEYRDGSNAAEALHLHHYHDGSWSYMEAKTVIRAGIQFEFRGLGPGGYRGTLDRGGECVVAEWQVDGMDIENQRVIAWPLTQR